MADATLRLVDIEGNELPTPTIVNQEVVFPEGYNWTWCLDGRIESYEALEEQEVLRRAAGVRKRYVLFNASGDDA